jgi:regulator of protease activity HflC (stomatin/prohibitin superfamily)
MKKFLMSLLIAVSAFAMQGCTRIVDGEVGVRVSSGGTIESAELMTGYHQTMFGSIIEFPVRDITLAIDNMTPMASENVPFADFDMSILYNINPQAVAELYKTKARSFHSYDEHSKDTYLMYNYVSLLAKNAAYKAVRSYKSLEATDKRPELEVKIKELVVAELTKEGLADKINISAVQIRGIVPNRDILASSTAVVTAENALKVKNTEIAIAESEARRMKALSENSKQSTDYMQAQASLTIAQAIAAGKVQTIIVPSNMTSLMLK